MRVDYVDIYERLEREHWWWIARRRLISNLLKTLPIPKEGTRHTLLDIGCGSGMTLASLQHNYDCTGIEPDSHLVERARENSGVPVLQVSFPLEQGTLSRRFHVVLLLDVLEHLKEDEMGLRSAAEQLSEDGFLIINVPAMPWLWSVHDEVNQHYRRYTARQLEQVLQNSGLAIRMIRYWGCFLAPLAYLGRKFERRTKDGKYRVSVPPRLINWIMIRSVLAEFSITAHVPVPLGLSLLAVAQRKSLQV